MGTEIFVVPFALGVGSLMAVCRRCGLPCPVHVLYFVIARRDLDTGEVLFVLRRAQGPYALHERCRQIAQAQRGLVFVIVRTPAVGGG